MITFVAKAAQVYLGDAGLYLAGAIAGLTDVDAIALSMAQLARGDPTNADAAARAIVIAVARTRSSRPAWWSRSGRRRSGRRSQGRRPRSWRARGSASGSDDEDDDVTDDPW